MNSAPEGNQPRNWTRRVVGALILLSPAMFLFASLLNALGGGHRPIFDNLWFYLAAAAIATLNFYLSFIRSTIWKRTHKSMDGFKYVSGLPLIGTICSVVACHFSYGALGSTLVGIGILALDTGGLPWFLFLTWSDAGLWDSHDIKYF